MSPFVDRPFCEAVRDAIAQGKSITHEDFFARGGTMGDVKDARTASQAAGDQDDREDERMKVQWITLRDWFAGQALAGLCANGSPHFIDGVRHTVQDTAYRLADAMVQARAR